MSEEKCFFLFSINSVAVCMCVGFFLSCIFRTGTRTWENYEVKNVPVFRIVFDHVSCIEFYAIKLSASTYSLIWLLVLYTINFMKMYVHRIIAIFYRRINLQNASYTFEGNQQTKRSEKKIATQKYKICFQAQYTD